MRNPRRLSGLFNPEASAAGDALAVEVRTTDGGVLDVEIPAAEIGELVQALVGCSAHFPTRPRYEAPAFFFPIPVQGLGLAAGATADETLLVVRLPGFDLAFSLASTRVAALGREFSQVAAALSATGEQTS